MGRVSPGRGQSVFTLIPLQIAAKINQPGAGDAQPQGIKRPFDDEAHFGNLACSPLPHSHHHSSNSWRLLTLLRFCGVSQTQNWQTKNWLPVGTFGCFSHSKFQHDTVCHTEIFLSSGRFYAGRVHLNAAAQHTQILVTMLVRISSNLWFQNYSHYCTRIQDQRISKKSGSKAS